MYEERPIQLKIVSQTKELEDKTESVYENICCTREVLPLMESSSWTKKWIFPAMKLYLDGDFKIFVTNSDYLNTHSVDDASIWAESQEFRVTRSMFALNSKSLPKL